MEMKIKNLGPIKTAFLKNADLTVIVGDNGSGKTLLLEAQTFIEDNYRIKMQQYVRTIFNKYSEDLVVEADWSEVNKFLESYPALKTKDPINFDVEIKLENTIMKKINQDILDYLEKLKQEIIEGLNKEILMREEPNKQLELEVNINPPEISLNNSFTCQLILTQKKLYLRIFKNTFELIGMARFNMDLLNDKHKMDDIFNIDQKIEFIDPLNELYDQFKKNIKFYTIHHLFRDFTHTWKTLFLPSERNLYMDNALTKTLNENYHNRYSYNSGNSKIRFSEHLFNYEYLNFKDDLNRFSRTSLKINNKLKEMFGGEPILDEEGDLKFIESEDGTRIKRELFSTKQSRLIPYLIVELKAYRKIIIEEPEAHLSLRGIKELLEYFKFLLEDKINITITTHSDVFFTHLNNLILENENFNTKVYELKYSDDGSYLEEKQITEQGYEIDLFTQELEDLFEKTLEIQEKIEHEEE